MKQLQIFIFLTIMTAPIEAQQRIYPNFQANANFQIGIPLENFRDNLSDAGFGGGIVFVVHLGDSPLAAGVDISLMGYASESARYNVQIGGFLREYELRTSNNIFLGHAVLRFQPPVNAFIRPYFDGMIGTKNLFTTTTLTDREIDEQVDSGTDHTDWALSYGGAIGLQIYFSRNSNAVLDLRCAYLPGTNASYLVRKPDVGLNYNDPIEAFEEKTSPTTLLLPQIGITFRGLFERHQREMYPDDENN